MFVFHCSKCSYYYQYDLKRYVLYFSRLPWKVLLFFAISHSLSHSLYAPLPSSRLHVSLFTTIKYCLIDWMILSVWISRSQSILWRLFFDLISFIYMVEHKSFAYFWTCFVLISFIFFFFLSVCYLHWLFVFVSPFAHVAYIVFLLFINLNFDVIFPDVLVIDRNDEGLFLYFHMFPV